MSTRNAEQASTVTAMAGDTIKARMMWTTTIAPVPSMFRKK